MTDHNRKELRRALIRAEHEWPGNLERRIDAILSVFEQAHAPTIDERYVAAGNYVLDTETDEIAPVPSDEHGWRLAKQLNSGIPREKVHWWSPPYDKATEDAKFAADVATRAAPGALKP